MILIYTQKITPRITYTFHQVLGKILGFKIKFTSKVEEFIAHDGLKFSYGKKRLGNEFFVKEFGLLTAQGISEIEIPVKQWDDLPCFFKVGEESDVLFDIFSASFFLLSRYEEYLPHVKDELGRYPAKESLGYKHNFLKCPVVDFWAYKFKTLFQNKFSEKTFPTREYKTTNMLVVAQVYKFLKKGAMRNLGGAIEDLIHLKAKLIYERIRTLLYLKKDPYDIYVDLIKYSKQHHIKWSFMFQLSDFSVHNKNISYSKMSYHTLIKSMSDYGKTGLLLGYDALFDIDELKKEKKRWENIVNHDLQKVLSNDYGLNLPNFYNNCDQLEIAADYSMGYVDKVGFRAGTCTPFLFYDLNLERISPLRVYPSAFNSKAFKPSSFFEVKTHLERIKRSVKSVQGNLLMIFHNADFAEGGNQEKYYQLLEMMNE